MFTKSSILHNITVLSGLMLLFAFALGGCGDKKSDDKGEDKGPDKGADMGGGGGGRGKRVAELKAAWDADKNCQALVKCCEEIKGHRWEQSIGTICKSLPQMMNFEQQVKDLVDVAWQAHHCKNVLQSVGTWGNEDNPLPAPCAAGGKPEMPK